MGKFKARRIAKGSKAPAKGAQTIIVVAAPPKARPKGGNVGKRRHYRRAAKAHKPSKAQIAKGALGTMALAVPLGTVAAFGASALDGYQVSKGGWAPPVIGWRGLLGLGVLTVGALTRSPVGVGIGAVLFGSSIPQATRSIGAALQLGGHAEAGAALQAAGVPMGLPGNVGGDDEIEEIIGALGGDEDMDEDALIGALVDELDGLNG